MALNSKLITKSRLTLELGTKQYFIGKSEKAIEGIFASIYAAGSYTVIFTDLPDSYVITDRNGPWRMLTVRGTLEFEVVGVIAAISSTLAEARIPLFVVSSYDTDHILVRSEKVSSAVNALKSGGFEILNDPVC